MKNVTPATAAIIIVGIAAIVLLALFGSERYQIVIAGSVGILVAGAARALFGEADIEPPPDPPDGRGMLGVLLLLSGTIVVAGGVNACDRVEKQQVRDATEAVDGGCKLVEAVTDAGTPKSVCAAAAELDSIVRLITAKRADAGTFGRRAKCSPVADTSLCATNEERLEAIEATLRKRGGGQ